MSAKAAPRPTLSVFDATAIIVGVVIGAGIFETPSLVAASAGSSGVALVAWLAGGVVTLVGALCYAELATAYPHPGGNYHYLMRAFGVSPAFLLAWARLAVIQTGALAMLGFVFGDYATQILRLGEFSPAYYAAAAIVVFTAINVLGLRQGRFTQNLLTLLTLAGLATVVFFGLTMTPAAPAAAADAPQGGAPSAAASVGLMMIFVLLTYGGWSEAAYISAEVRDVRRNMARALLGSIAIITGVYILVNYALLRGLGVAGAAGVPAVAAELMRQAAGPAGAVFLSALVSVAVLGSMNATVITGARTNYALGRDYAMFAGLGQWSGSADTPRNALLVQGAIALALVLLGAGTREGFKTMVEYTTPVFWLFLLLTGLSLFVLRRREPHVERPFRVPLYPLTPILFCAFAAYMMYASLVYTGIGALVGAAVLLAGTPLLLFVRRREVLRNHLRATFTPGVEPGRRAV